MKYIVRNDGTVILFSHAIIHSWMSHAEIVVSAGFCSVSCVDGEVEIEVWGESTTLGKKSDQQDVRLIRNLLGL